MKAKIEFDDSSDVTVPAMEPGNWLALQSDVISERFSAWGWTPNAMRRVANQSLSVLGRIGSTKVGIEEVVAHFGARADDEDMPNQWVRLAIEMQGLALLKQGDRLMCAIHKLVEWAPFNYMTDIRQAAIITASVSPWASADDDGRWDCIRMDAETKRDWEYSAVITGLFGMVHITAAQVKMTEPLCDVLDMRRGIALMIGGSQTNTNDMILGGGELEAQLRIGTGVSVLYTRLLSAAIANAMWCHRNDVPFEDYVARLEAGLSVLPDEWDTHEVLAIIMTPTEKVTSDVGLRFIRAAGHGEQEKWGKDEWATEVKAWKKYMVPREEQIKRLLPEVGLLSEAIALEWKD